MESKQISTVPVTDLHPHEKNPRVTAAEVEDLVASIRANGVEVALVAAPRPEGGYTVVAGHRRLTAALEVGLTEVPVQIRPDLVDEREQLAFVAVENMHRENLSPLEESRLFQDMLDLGMTQSQIAKATSVKRPVVAERVKLGKLGAETGEKVHRGQISLTEALVIAEYADSPDAVADLEQSAGTPNFDWALSRAKQSRERQQEIAAARKELRKAGVREADEAADFLPLAELSSEGRWATKTLDERAGEDMPDEEWATLLVAEHASCPGHCARIGYRGIVYGCDAAEDQHPAGTAAAEVEAEPDPWAEITPDDFAAARIHREQHLAKHLPGMDCFDEAKKLAAESVAKHAWTGYWDDEHAIAFLEALTGAEGKAKVLRALKAWPLEVLVWFDANWHDLHAHHRYMGDGRQGTSYWGEKGALRRLLERTDYVWSAPEQKAILLATGRAWDAEDGAEVEGGVAA